MKLLREHPTHVAQQERYESLRQNALRDGPFMEIEIDRLAVGLRHLLQLDPTAVYHVVGNSTIVYYDSGHMPKPPGHVARIVLGPDGSHRRIDTVGFDPRGVAVAGAA